MADRRRRSSVLTEEQQNFLERRLQNRPDKVPATVAASLQATAKKLERSIIKDNLNQHLYTREDPDTVGHMKHLFKGSDVAPGIRAAKVKLEHSITRDQIGHLLEGRPEPEDLERAGITQPLDRAGRIQGLARKLERSMTQNKVGHLLERRSEVEDLEAKAVLKDSRVAPAVQKQQLELQKNLARSNLYHALKYRPSVVELIEKGVYQPLPNDEEDQYYEDQYYEDQYYDQDYDQGYDQGYEEDRGYEQEYDQGYQQPQVETGYARRSKNFHLTRILLKFVASMGASGELSVEQKGFLKDLIVDQDQTILAVADTFDADNDLHDFKDSLTRLAMRRAD